MPNRLPSFSQKHPQPEHRDLASRGMYGKKWRQARLRYLKKHPLCKLCYEAHRIEQATVVDHIVPHRGDVKLFWDRDNWMSLCKVCHDRKTGQGL